MMLIAFVTASPLLAFEMKVPCQASPASTSSVRDGARDRKACTCPASCAMPPAWKLELVLALCTRSVSRWPWMSSVWSSCMRSAASAADGDATGVATAVGLGATVALHAMETTRASAMRSRRTRAMVGTTYALAVCSCARYWSS